MGIWLTAQPPASSPATLDTRAGGATPAENVIVWDFDASAGEYMDFLGILPNGYNNAGLTLSLGFTMTTGTTGDVVLRAGIRRLDTSEDIGSAHSYDFNGTTHTVESTGEMAVATITFTDGADMDNLSAGEPFLLRVNRNSTSSGDGAVGDLELALISLRET